MMMSANKMSTCRCNSSAYRRQSPDESSVRASPLISFMYSPMNYLSESHGSLGSFGVPLSLRYNNTSAATINIATATLATVEIIAMIVEYDPSINKAKLINKALIK